MLKSKAAILVIESHPMLLEAFCTVIASENENAEVFGTDGILQAIGMAAAHQPDLILFAMESSLPEDAQALSHLHQALPGIPILALTSDEVPGQAQAALEHGAQAVVSKTGQRGELLVAIHDLISKTFCSEQSPETKETSKQKPSPSQVIVQQETNSISQRRFS